MRVMTWNIRSAAGGDDIGPIPDRVGHLTRLAAVLRAVDADIVGLQEVDRFWARSGGVDQAERLGDLAGMASAFVANWLPEGGDQHERVPQYGVALLSRWPIVEVEHVLHGTPAGWEPRGSLVATVQPPGAEAVSVAVTHLQVDPPDRPGAAADQRREGLAHTLASSPSILMGDFNALPGSMELEPLGASWTDAWLAVHGNAGGATFPALRGSEPGERIDYIFVPSGSAIRDARVVVDAETRLVSDHYPLVVDLEVA